MRLSRKENESLQDRLMREMNYPNKAIFRFDGCNGIADADKVKKIVCDAGSENRSDLVICSNHKRRLSL